jgi:hypothetical protein
MSSFARVPDELWVAVLSNFDRKQDQKTINALRLTNKKFNDLVEPLIYCIVTDDVDQLLRSPDAKIGQLQQWAWRIAEQPKYARFLKEINLKDWDHIGKDNPVPTTKGKPPFVGDRYEYLIKKTGLPVSLKAALLTDLKKEISVAHLAFLLAMCTELEVLNIPQAYEVFGKLVIEVIKYATSCQRDDQPQTKRSPRRSRSVLPTPMSCVREMTIGGFNYQTSVEDTLSLLPLPGLSYLSVYGLCDTRNHWEHDIPQTENTILNKNNLSLIFDSCMLGGEGLAKILFACSWPRSLVVRWRPGLWNEHLHNPDIGKALREAGTKLQDLHLDTTDVYNHRYDPIGHTPSFGSFTALAKLHTLAVPCYAFAKDHITAEDHLPPSLKKLFVLGVENEEDAAKYKEVGVENVIVVGWKHYSIEEWFGNVPHKCVDYSSVEELKLEPVDRD